MDAGLAQPPSNSRPRRKFKVQRSKYKVQAVTDTELVDAFIREIGKSEDQKLFRQFLPEGVAPEDVAPLLTEPWHEEDPDVSPWAPWRPLRVQTPPDVLKAFYERVPGPLPSLYERLILTCHWGEVDLGEFRLLPNFPPALDGLVSAIQNDAFMFRVLSSHKLVQFGKGPDVDYDPVCFDLNQRSADGDCAIVKADHEEILIHERLRVVGVLASSFRELVRRTIASGNPV